MKQAIENIRQQSILEIENSKDLKELNDIRVKYLGKKGELTSVLRGMGALSAEERPIIGSLVNVVKNELEELISGKEEQFKHTQELLTLTVCHVRRIRKNRTKLNDWREC